MRFHDLLHLHGFACFFRSEPRGDSRSNLVSKDPVVHLADRAHFARSLTGTGEYQTIPGSARAGREVCRECVLVNSAWMGWLSLNTKTVVGVPSDQVLSRMLKTAQATERLSRVSGTRAMGNHFHGLRCWDAANTQKESRQKIRKSKRNDRPRQPWGPSACGIEPIHRARAPYCRTGSLRRRILAGQRNRPSSGTWSRCNRKLDGVD